MKQKKRLALLAFVLFIMIPMSYAIAAYSKTFTLTAEVTLQLPDVTPTATPSPTPEPTPEPTPTPDPSKQIRVVYHAGYSNTVVEDSAPRKSSFTLPGALFERDGYKQIGWTSSSNGTTVEFAFGDTQATGNNTLHFYAVWEEAASATPTPEAALDAPEPDGTTPSPTITATEEGN